MAPPSHATVFFGVWRYRPRDNIFLGPEGSQGPSQYIGHAHHTGLTPDCSPCRHLVFLLLPADMRAALTSAGTSSSCPKQWPLSVLHFNLIPPSSHSHLPSTPRASQKRTKNKEEGILRQNFWSARVQGMMPEVRCECCSRRDGAPQIPDFRGPCMLHTAPHLGSSSILEPGSSRKEPVCVNYSVMSDSLQQRGL